METHKRLEREHFACLSLECVARYLEKEDVVRCGKPDIAWNDENCLLKEHERFEKEMSGRCRFCRSFEIARKRAAKEALA